MTDTEKVFAELKALREEVRNSDGALLESELTAVARTNRLFQRNAFEFVEYLGRFDVDTKARLELWDVRNRAGFDAFLDEVDRLLHNYLAAAATLRDHTRRLWQKYAPQDQELTAEYDRRLKETFAESPLTQFVQRLRNYSLHTKLPLVTGRLTWTQEEGDRSTVELSRAALLEWDGWNTGARTFIESRDDGIDLRTVVNEYTALVDEFNQWYSHAFVKGHLPTFEALNALKIRFNEALRQSGLAGHEDT